MPYASFLVIHFEVGSHTESLEHQALFWPAVADLLTLAKHYKVNLTLQFTPQWAEYIIRDQSKLGLLKRWQHQGHEVGLHHHGYDHADWDGFINREGKEDDPGYSGNVGNMMGYMRQLVHPYQICSGTITDEEFDYPQGIKYDTEGIQIYHARSRPKRVTLGDNSEVIQVSMAFLSFEGDIESFECEYEESQESEIFGLVTHEKDFARNPEIIEEWLRLIRSRGETIKTVSEIIPNYQKAYSVEYNNKPLNFLCNVMDADIGRHKRES